MCFYGKSSEISGLELQIASVVFLSFDNTATVVAKPSEL
jgi:hypothetical protein